MNRKNKYADFLFDRPAWGIPPRLVPVGIALIGFIIFWRIMSATAMFWLLLVILCLLTWMASYGWRQALITLIRFLERLTF